MLAVPLLVLLTQSDDPHRHIPNERFPIPDWVTDPQLRGLLKEEFKNGDLSRWLSDPRDREQLLRWLKTYLESGGDLKDSKRLWDDMNQRYPELARTFKRRVQGQMDGARFRRLFEKMGRKFDADGGKLRRWFDPRIMEEFGKPDTSPWGNEVMNQLFGEQDWNETLGLEIEKTFDRFESIFGRWGDSGMARALEAATPQAPTPAGGGGGGPGAAGGRPQAATPPALLPALRQIGSPSTPSTTLLWIFVAVTGGGMLIYLLLMWSENRRTRPRRAPPERFDPPRLPAAFDTRKEFFDFYRALHRWLLKRRLTGLSHREIAEAAGSGEVSELFEGLFYDPRAGSERLGQAHELCRRLSTR
jgi:hypothetical protein